jgi:hypothetical protein
MIIWLLKLLFPKVPDVPMVHQCPKKALNRASETRSLVEQYLPTSKENK